MYQKKSISVWQACNKIRSAICRDGISLWKCFKALDPVEDGLISEVQFVSVLSGPLKLTIGLSDEEISKITNYFRVQDGRIMYSNFCDVIYGEVPNFSKNDPLTTGLEWNDPHHVNEVSKSEGKRLQILLTKIATSLNMRRLVLRPYFQDYELIAKGNGNVTVSHFARVLHFHGILLSADEFKLLCRKFMKDSYYINYVAFLAALSEINCNIDKHRLLGYRATSTSEIDQIRNQGMLRPCTSLLPATELNSLWNRHDAIEKIIGRIRRYAVANRIRTGEFFKDFDVMNCGKITAEQFRRGLDAFGISGTHHLYLSEHEIKDLYETYKDLNDPSHICWKVFENDIDLIFTTKNLEKYPNLRVKNPGNEKKDSIPTVFCGKNSLSQMPRMLCEDVVQKIRIKITTHRLNLRTHFKDYDRLNNGHVTIPQFRQCLVYYGLLCSPEEIAALEGRYCDGMGFNYNWFLREVEPKPLEDPWYDDFIKEKILINSKKMLETPTNKEKDIAAIMAKIKSKVVCKGTRILDFFVDYDKLSKQIISKENFARGLSLCDFKLTNTEVNTIVKAFSSPFHDGYVDYRRFCSIVESACAVPGLEKKPLFVPLKHIPLMDADCNFLNAEERAIVDGALQTLASKSIYDQNLLPCFKDFDISNCGSISRNHFMRVMALRKMTDHLSSKQLDVLAKCFCVKRGSAEEVDYRAFCKSLDILVEISKKKVI